MHEILEHLIQKKDLTYKMSHDFVTKIMKGEMDETLLSAILVLLRSKGETSNEISDFASVMRSHASSIILNDINAIDIVGTGGDGLNTFNISTACSFVCAASGVITAKHGNRSASSLSGSADVLEAYGININLSAEKVALCIKKLGLGFLFAPTFHPAMKYAKSVRSRLKIKNYF